MSTLLYHQDRNGTPDPEDRLSPIRPRSRSLSTSPPDSDESELNPVKDETRAEREEQGHLASLATLLDGADPDKRYLLLEKDEPMVRHANDPLQSERAYREQAALVSATRPRKDRSQHQRHGSESARHPERSYREPPERLPAVTRPPIEDEYGPYTLPKLEQQIPRKRLSRDSEPSDIHLPHLRDILEPSPVHRRTMSSSSMSTISAHAPSVITNFPSAGGFSSDRYLNPFSPDTSQFVESPSTMSRPSTSATTQGSPIAQLSRVTPIAPLRPAARQQPLRINSTASTISTTTTQSHLSPSTGSSSTEAQTPGTQPTPSDDMRAQNAALAKDNDDQSRSTATGGFRCRFEGCNAPPFATQYLLNSHRNVHSQDRPHFCPVPGCKRGPGGKGFKRKNEMIRHQLVHNSPGYVCPYCPDQSHTYPRPDNLQRHVTLHHKDKDKADQTLRDVLAVKPVGMGTAAGRRRRGT